MENGIVYNAAVNKYIYPNEKIHKFTLLTIKEQYKTISQKTLYRMIYNKQFCNDNIQNKDNEIWKEIDRTNGVYYISNSGRVKSLKGYNAIILKPFYNKGGYARVDIVQDGKKTTKLIHRLVAAAFLPFPQSIEMQIHHKDFDNTNNAADNLQWLNPAEHRKKHIEKEIKKNG